MHQPLSVKDMAVITSKTDHVPLPAPEKTDADGVRNKHYRWKSMRHKLSTFFYADNVAKPTMEEIEAGQHHAGHDAAIEAPLHAYEDADVIRRAHGGVLHHPGMAETNAEQLEQERSQH